MIISLILLRRIKLTLNVLSASVERADRGRHQREAAGVQERRLQAVGGEELRRHGQWSRGLARCLVSFPFAHSPMCLLSGS